MVLLEQIWFYSEKSSFIRTRWLFSDIVFLFGKNGCIGTKVVVLGQKWLYSGKGVVFGQSGCICEKVVVFGESGFIKAKVVVIY